ncbi:hypothetical protein SynRS9915_02780 [Synechococcus sp. RS9915]|nr:hypothetical protein SynRS9915_02780 [Synechococcus sp. RS9915]
MLLSIHRISTTLIQTSSVKGSRRYTHQQSEAERPGLPHQNSIRFRTNACPQKMTNQVSSKNNNWALHSPASIND